MKKLAILGPGVVGGSCAEILLRDAALLERNAGEKLELSYVLARRELPDRPYRDLVVTDFSVIERDADVFLVMETIGGCGAALEYVRRALAAGKHVVTANKQLIAEHGAELLALAKANGVSLLFEASVGGGIPVLHPLSQCLGANEIYEVRGILNGTTNFILTQMLEHGQSYEAALRDAQARGYAEQDPTADVEGIDAGRKICILADMMFGKNVDPSRVSMTGISTITAEDAAARPGHPAGAGAHSVCLAAFHRGFAAAIARLRRSERRRGVGQQRRRSSVLRPRRRRPGDGQRRSGRCDRHRPQSRPQPARQLAGGARCALRSGGIRIAVLLPHAAFQRGLRAGARPHPLAARRRRVLRRLYGEDHPKGAARLRPRAGRGVAGAGIKSF